MKLICIGSATIDSIIKGFDPEFVSKTGYFAQSGSIAVGGEAVNTSVAAAKLGLDTSAMVHLGNDDAGDMVFSTLVKNGVNVSHVIRDEQPTPVATMFVDDEGNRKTIKNSAHLYNFHPENYLDALLGYDAVTLQSLFRPPFTDMDTVEKILKFVKDAGSVTYVDTKLPHSGGYSLESLEGIGQYIDFFTPNEDEARFITGMTDGDGLDAEEAADRILKKGVHNAVIKLGAKGMLVKGESTDGKALNVPAYRVDAVDATGAGDNSLAGLIATGDPAFACACGAICASYIGAITHVKDMEYVREWMKEHR